MRLVHSHEKPTNTDDAADAPAENLYLQWNVRHFFTWIEQRVFGTLTQYVLGSANKHSKHQRCRPD